VFPQVLMQSMSPLAQRPTQVARPAQAWLDGQAVSCAQQPSLRHRPHALAPAGGVQVLGAAPSTRGGATLPPAPPAPDAPPVPDEPPAPDDEQAALQLSFEQVRKLPSGVTPIGKRLPQAFAQAESPVWQARRQSSRPTHIGAPLHT
jgi:hypothetical protein